jgi:hypothetical protein
LISGNNGRTAGTRDTGGERRLAGDVVTLDSCLMKPLRYSSAAEIAAAAQFKSLLLA